MNSRAFLGRIVVLRTTATISLLGCLLLSYLSGCNPQEAVQEVTKTVGSSCVSGGYSKMHERRGIIPSLEPGFGGWFLTN